MNQRARTKKSTAKTQVLSCGCSCRTYDGKMVVVNGRCTHHRLHYDFRLREQEMPTHFV